jgi:hypothetical protein
VRRPPSRGCVRIGLHCLTDQVRQCLVRQVRQGGFHAGPYGASPGDLMPPIACPPGYHPGDTSSKDATANRRAKKPGPPRRCPTGFSRPGPRVTNERRSNGTTCEGLHVAANRGQ